MELLVLGEGDVRTAGLSPAEYVAIAREVFRDLGEGRASLPPKTYMPLEGTRYINAMPAYLPRLGYAGVKWIGAFVDREHRYVTRSVVVLSDADSCIPVAMVAADEITLCRTAAVSVLASEMLAPPGWCYLGLIGAGRQGCMHARFFASCHSQLRSILVYDCDPRASQQIQAVVERLGIKAHVVSSPQEVVESAQVLVFASSSPVPVLESRQIPEGTLTICITGFDDLEVEYARRVDRFVVDSWACFRARMGAVLGDRLRQEDVHAELGQIVAGICPGRLAAKSRILFASIGVGAMDVGVAAEVLRRARELGLGRMVSLS